MNHFTVRIVVLIRADNTFAPAQMIRYYLITDIGTQWFSYIIACRESTPTPNRSRCYDVVDYFKLDSDIKSEFIDNVRQRELHFGLAEFGGWTEWGDYYGWSLSKKEFDTIKELIYLYPTVLKFEKLSK